MSEFKKKAFDAALDLVKQLITLATGILALTATFMKDILDKLHPKPVNIMPVIWILYLGWFFIFISIFAGLLGHGALTGTMNNIANDDDEGITVYKQNVKSLVTSQWIFFLTGVLFIIVFAIKAT